MQAKYSIITSLIFAVNIIAAPYVIAKTVAMEISILSAGYEAGATAADIFGGNDRASDSDAGFKPRSFNMLIDGNTASYTLPIRISIPSRTDHYSLKVKALHDYIAFTLSEKIGENNYGTRLESAKVELCLDASMSCFGDRSPPVET